MPADKLVLLCTRVKANFQELVREKGRQKGGYSQFLDLRQTESRLPVQLFWNGFHNGANKIEFVGVAKLGLRRVQQIVELICGDPRWIRITRIDWAVDIEGVSVWTVSECCRVFGVLNSGFYRSRSGISFYPHRSRERTILIYDRLKRLKSQHDPSARMYENGADLTRIEVQFRGRGVPIRDFIHIRDYGEINLLRNVVFFTPLRLVAHLKPQQLLAGERLLFLVKEYGLQNVAKRFPPAVWTHLTRKFFNQTSAPAIPDVHALMQKSARDWLNNRIRFPRLGPTCD